MLFEEHFAYIERCALIHAREIDTLTGRTDWQDNQQEMLLYVWKRVDRYDGTKGSVQTFISHLIRAKRVSILRHMRRKKVIMIQKAIPFNHA